jgi:hypothetical protein
VVDLRCRSDELKNTWPNEFSLPDLPRAAQSYRDKKVRRPSTNAYHLSPKVGEVPEDLPQQLRHAIADTLASTETSSNSNFHNSDYNNNYDDDYQGSTGFTKLQKMQRFLRINDYLFNDEPFNDDFLDRFAATSSHGRERDNQVPMQNSVCQDCPPLSSLLIPPLNHS